MRIETFQEKLKATLGSQLENATPANVREFIDRMQQELWREDHPHTGNSGGLSRIEIHSSPQGSYEELMQNFFARALVADRDQSLIQLWLLALDLAYTGIAEMHAEKLSRLFGDETTA